MIYDRSISSIAVVPARRMKRSPSVIRGRTRRWARICAPQTCIRWTTVVPTMMQPCASVASSEMAGPSFSSAQRPCCSSGRHHLGSLRDDLRVRRSSRNGKQRCHVGVRSTTPSGTSPTVTMRHRATSNLRASATIIVLRVPVRASAVRVRNHCASALSF